MIEDDFSKNCAKAICFVTTDASPNEVTLYFSAGAFDDARRAAPVDQEPEEQEIFDALHQKTARYPFIKFLQQEESFEESERLRGMAAEGKLIHVHAANFETAWPQIEHLLKIRQTIRGVSGNEPELALERDDHVLSKEDGIPENTLKVGDVAETLRLVEQTQQDKSRQN